MSDHLSAGELADLRADLERQLARLRRTMASTGDASQPVVLDQSSMGRLSRMDAMASQAMSKALHGREQALELRITEALQRLDEGSYGRCQSCGAPLPYGRLLVMPEARSCATCGGG